LPVLGAGGVGAGWTSLTLDESREISLELSESELLEETLGESRELSLVLSQESGWPEETFRVDVLLDDPVGVTDFLTSDRTITEQLDDSADDPFLQVASEGDALTADQNLVGSFYQRRGRRRFYYTSARRRLQAKGLKFL
jgi:hypothetical protein